MSHTHFAKILFQTILFLKEWKQSFSLFFYIFLFVGFFLILGARANRKRRELVFDLFYIYHFWLRILEVDPITRNPLPRAITQFPVHTCFSMFAISPLWTSEIWVTFLTMQTRGKEHNRGGTQLKTAPGITVRGQGRGTQFLPAVTSKQLLLRSARPLVINS